jgi:hypothetical protein
VFVAKSESREAIEVEVRKLTDKVRAVRAEQNYQKVGVVVFPKLNPVRIVPYYDNRNANVASPKQVNLPTVVSCGGPSSKPCFLLLLQSSKFHTSEISFRKKSLCELYNFLAPSKGDRDFHKIVQSCCS